MKTLFTILIIAGSLTFSFSQDIAKHTKESEPEIELFIKNGFYVDREGNPFSGVLPKYNEDGSKIAEYSYINGRRHGEAVVYYNNGVLKEMGNYQYNERHGKWRVWDEKGNLKTTGNYKEGKQHGHWYFYYPNGKKKLQRNFNMGEKVGHWIWWDENGKVTKNILF